MSLKVPTQTAMLWRLALVRFGLFSAASLWTCWTTATANLNMTLLSSWDWFQTIGGCLASWCLVIIAFLDKSAHQIQSGQIPGLENGEHQNETKL